MTGYRYSTEELLMSALDMLDVAAKEQAKSRRKDKWLKAYPRASGTTISGGEKRRLMIEHIANMSSPEDPPCLIFRTP